MNDTNAIEHNNSNLAEQADKGDDSLCVTFVSPNRSFKDVSANYGSVNTRIIVSLTSEDSYSYVRGYN